MQRSDEAIRIDVVEALSRDSRVNSARITVTVDAGRVVLNGDTPTLYTLHVAQGLAASVSGIRSIENQLSVSRPPSVQSDADIRVRAQQVLRWNESIAHDKIDVTVDAGTVTLRGQVDASWKRTRAELLVLDIHGITGLANELNVVPDLTPQDRVIAEDVRSAIVRCTCLGDDSITVEVDHGLVTLKGEVPNWWSKYRTPSIAEHVLGVKGVIDELIVAQ